MPRFQPPQPSLPPAGRVALPGVDPYLRLRLGAGLALLQPGIDPVFLVILSSHSGLALADHGLVVGASQAGMAAGALIAATASRLPLAALRAVAAAGAIASLATVLADGLAAILAIRAIFGLAAGVLYAATLRAATAQTPAHAMGTILFFQLLLATLVALALPGVAEAAGPAAALACLVAVPLASLLLLAPQAAVAAAPLAAPTNAGPAPVHRGFDAAALAAFLFVAASTMIWSYAGAEGVVAGLSSTVIGLGVAFGSIAASLAALAVARGVPRLPVLASAGASALLMATPFVVPAGAAAYILAMIAFNIGSTYAVARFSALAIGRRDSARAMVPALQSIAMALGPLGAALAVGQGGFAALFATTTIVLAGAVAALVCAATKRDEAPPRRLRENHLSLGAGP